MGTFIKGLRKALLGSNRQCSRSPFLFIQYTSEPNFFFKAWSFAAGKQLELKKKYKAETLIELCVLKMQFYQEKLMQPAVIHYQYKTQKKGFSSFFAGTE